MSGRFWAIVISSFILVSCSSDPAALVSRHVKRGDEYMASEKYREAVIEYKNAVKEVPNDSALRLKLANASIQAKDIRTAFQELQKAVELDPENYKAMGLLGEIYVAAGMTEEATRIADELIKKQPDNPSGYILMSGLAAREGRLDDSIGFLMKAAKLDPANPKPRITLGNLFLLKHDRIHALEWYDKAVALAPDDEIVHVARGNFFFATGDREEGEKEYRKAIDLSKDKENLRVALAEHFLYQGRMDESEKELKTVIQEMNSQKARKVLAEIMIESGKVNEAVPIVEEIVRENEKDLDGKYLKGRIALSEKRLTDAKALFGEVVRQDAGMARAHLYNGMTEVLMGQVELGKKEIVEATRLDPGNARAHLVLGDLYLRSNAPAAAEKEAVEILKRNPSNLRAVVLYGDSFLLRKNWMQAEEVYTTIMKRMPENPIGYFKMGIAKKLQQKHADAARFFSQAIDRDPRDLDAINEYVFAMMASGNTVKAQQMVEESFKKEPQNPFVWEMAGRFRLANSEPKEAEADFLKAIEIAPDYTKPYYELAVLYATQKRLPEAEDNLRRVIVKNDRSVGAHTLLGVVLNAQGKVEDANRQYRRVLELDPRNALAANNLAANLSDHGGNLDEALQFAQKAREEAPEDPNVADTLGWIYYKKELIDTAYPLIEEAVKKQERNPVVRYHYGMVLAKKERNKEARANLKAALSMSSDFPGVEDARKTLASLK